MRSIAGRLSLVGKSIPEVGLLLKHALLEGDLSLSAMSRHLLCTLVGKVNDVVDRDVLPLPVAPSCPEEGRIFTALRAGTAPHDVSRDFSKSIKVAGRSAWLFLVVVALNFLALGHRPPPAEPGPVQRVDISDAQASCLEYLEEQVDIFCELTEGTIPECNWDRALLAVTEGYSGSRLLKGLPVSWAQVEPTLPPPELAGRVPAVAVASPHIQEWLKHPEWSIKPRAEWPRRFRRSWVRCKPGEYPELIKGLYRRHIVASSRMATCTTIPRGTRSSMGSLACPRKTWRRPRLMPPLAPCA